MKKILIGFTAVILIIIASLYAFVIYIDEGPLEELPKGTTEVVYFSADWCKPCKTYGPLLKAMSNSQGVRVNEIDLSDNDTFKLYIKKYDIFALPTTLFIIGNDTIRRVGG